MGAATVRNTIRTYMDGIPGISRLYKDEPWRIVGTELADINGIDGTVAYLRLLGSTETRLTVPAVTGSKEVTWDVGFALLYQYVIPDDAATDDWVDDLDRLIDNIVNRIRADPSFGCGGNGPVFEAGSEPNDINVHFDQPRKNRGKVIGFASVTFKVIEIVTA